MRLGYKLQQQFDCTSAALYEHRVERFLSEDLERSEEKEEEKEQEKVEQDEREELFILYIHTDMLYIIKNMAVEGYCKSSNHHSQSPVVNTHGK